MKRMLLWMLLGLLTPACTLTTPSERTPDANASAQPFVVEQATLTPAPTPLPILDANFIFSDVCYEGVAVLAGQTIIIGDDAALANLYNTMDSQCEDEIARPGIDFSTQMLVVVVEVVRTCTAEFVAMGLENNHLMLQFMQSGTCAYDVVAVYAGMLARPAGELQVTVNRA